MFLSCITYFGSLVLCLSLGNYYKNISVIEMKRNFGTGLGILLTLLICRHYVIHSLLMVWINIVIIKCCNRRYMHQLSLVYTWTYLLYLHYNVKNIYVIWLHQLQALKLVGLAFEICENKIQIENSISVRPLDTNFNYNAKPSAAEIISYSYCFVGLHKGPYFKWKVFTDHLNEPYNGVRNWRHVTEQKLTQAVICGAAYLFLRAKYPPELYQNPIFYQKYGADLRFLYNIPLIIMYILYNEAIAMLTTSICTETGFGVFPKHKDSTRNSFLDICSDIDVSEEQFDFSSLQCFSNRKLFLGPKMIDTITSWDISTRHWFWSHLYKELQIADKKFRSALSFIAWTVWSGPTLPTVILASTIWLYIQLESEYSQLFKTNGSMNLPWDIGFSIMRIFCLLYLTPCIAINDTKTVFLYYNSIFWMYHFILFLLMIVVILAHKYKKI